MKKILLLLILSVVVICGSASAIIIPVNLEIDFSHNTSSMASVMEPATMLLLGTGLLGLAGLRRRLKK